MFLSPSFRRRLIGAVVGAIAATVLVQVPLRIRMADLRWREFEYQLLTVELLIVLAPIAGAVAGAFFALRRAVQPEDARGARTSNIRRTVIAAVLSLYLATWAFGVPASISVFSEQSAKWLERVAREKIHRLESDNPVAYVQPYFAFVPFPGLVLLKLRAGTWGGWAVCVWIPGRTWVLGREVQWMT